jgi:hypothetical protein
MNVHRQILTNDVTDMKGYISYVTPGTENRNRVLQIEKPGLWPNKTKAVAAYYSSLWMKVAPYCCCILSSV